MTNNVALANITGNIPCVCFIAGGIFLIERGFFGTGLFLLIMSAITVMHYKQTSGKSGDEKDERNRGR
jgi:hypothetical protein